MKPPKTENWTPTKPKEYKIYQLWRNLPPILRDPKIWEGEANNEILLELSHIKNHKQFSEKFGVHIDTLTDWKQRPVPPEYQTDYKDWAKELNANVMAILYKYIREEGDAARIKLWLQTNDQLVEKHEHNIGAELLQNIRAIAEKNAHGET